VVEQVGNARDAGGGQALGAFAAETLDLADLDGGKTAQ
jgi:hypothetical protein